MSVASPLNFEWGAVPTEVTVAMIKDAIFKRHGGATAELTLFREQVRKHSETKQNCHFSSLLLRLCSYPVSCRIQFLQAKPECLLQNEAGDDWATLKDLGIKGIVAGPEESLPLVKILYHWTTGQDEQCPIILIDGNDISSKFSINTKLYTSLERAEVASRVHGRS